MKFAKELDRDLVPEWRAKYLDYKQGKKKLKALARALRNVRQTPRTPRLRGPNPYVPTPFDTAPKYAYLNRSHTGRSEAGGDGAAQKLRSVAMRNAGVEERARDDGDKVSTPQSIPRSIATEYQPLTWEQNGTPQLRRYGSIIGSPSNGPALSDSRGRKPPELELPGPALDPDRPKHTPSVPPPKPPTRPTKNASFELPPPAVANAYEVGNTKQPPQHHSLPTKYRSIFKPKRVNSMPGIEGSRPLMRRVMSFGSRGAPEELANDVPLEAYREVDFRQAEFFNFLDKELEKIETFYKEKEDEATQRLNVLREQLHIMRDRRLEEIIERQTSKMRSRGKLSDANDTSADSGEDRANGNGKGLSKKVGWLKPIDDAIDAALDAAKSGRFGKGTQAMGELGTPSALRPRHLEENRDYTRRAELPDVPYRTAKRKLKIALQEYYRGLELLKSYALLNRTAFRKINKKYDKTVNARPSGRYMSEKVNHAWFVQSEVIDGHIRAVEDLYARYFEQGNHKVAVGKLRVKTARAGEYTQSSFRNGLMLAGGLIFGIEGVVYGSQLLYTGDPTLTVHTSYLLQVYGGYFMMVLLALLFCLDCAFWSINKINYSFVFEFDTRSNLDWRQLSELPFIFFFLNSLFLWLNFHRFGGDTMYLYWPVILIGLSLMILFFPARALYYKSRQWFLYSSWRLLLAGLYPVEFRDFFLGDLFCSLTYSMGNLELFFCLYAQDWSNPTQCNSSHSRLLGFFSTLPGIWRALQCIRRYYDTRNVFPHLVNCGKYTATILYYMSLSMYRLDKNNHMRAFFIFCATVNSVYTSIWDVIMDWSLGDPYAQYPFLRSVLGYKHPWMYYGAMFLDPILRFNWIFYAIYVDDLQHSAILSFLIALSEACRRGMWAIFRVENEHCTNVGRFRASRDIPLPYDIPTPTTATSPSVSARPTDEEQAGPHHPPTTPASLGTATGATLHPTQTRDTTASGRSYSTFRRRRPDLSATGEAAAPSPLMRGFSRVGNILHAAHAQDFERKRRPEDRSGRVGWRAEADDSDDEEDEEEGDAEHVLQEETQDERGQREAEAGEGDDREEEQRQPEEQSDLDRAEELVSEADDEAGRDMVGGQS